MQSPLRLGLVWCLSLNLASLAEAIQARPIPLALPATETVQTPSEPDQARIDAWLAAGRALKAQRPELFGGAEGVLAILMLPDGIAPGDVLVAYGDTPLGSTQRLVVLAGDALPEETVTQRPLDSDLVPNSRLDRPEVRSPAHADGNARQANTMTAAVAPAHIGPTNRPPMLSNRVAQGARTC